MLRMPARRWNAVGISKRTKRTASRAIHIAWKILIFTEISAVAAYAGARLHNVLTSKEDS